MEGPPLFSESFENGNDDDKATEKRSEKKSEKDQHRRVNLSGLFERQKPEDAKRSLFEQKPKEPEEERVEKEPEAEASQPEENSEVESETTELSEIDAEEQKHIVEEFAQDRTDTLQAELKNSQEEGPHHAEAIADALFIENLAEKVQGADGVTDEILDELVEETAEELDLPKEATQDNSPKQAQIEEEQEDALQSDPQGQTINQPITPPPPPPPPPPSNTPPTGGSSVPSGGFAPNNPFVRNTSPNTPPRVAENNPESSHSHAPFVLVGGLVGYLLGRRRGRIKTEARLKPVQEKLEEKVTELTDKIIEREQKIRSLARRSYESKPLDSAKAIETLNQKHARREIRKQPEPETPVLSGIERQPQNTFISETQTKVENLSLSELLEISKKIEYDRTDVKSIFETGRLDLESLKKVVREYLQNGDYRAELAKGLMPEHLPPSPELARNPETATQPAETQTPEAVQQPHRPMQNIEAIAQNEYGVGASTPPLDTYAQTKPISNSSDTFKKIMVGAVATVTVVILAVVVGLLLLAI